MHDVRAGEQTSWTHQFSSVFRTRRRVACTMRLCSQGLAYITETERDSAAVLILRAGAVRHPNVWLLRGMNAPSQTTHRMCGGDFRTAMLPAAPAAATAMAVASSAIKCRAGSTARYTARVSGRRPLSFTATPRDAPGHLSPARHRAGASSARAGWPSLPRSPGPAPHGPSAVGQAAPHAARVRSSREARARAPGRGSDPGAIPPRPAIALHHCMLPIFPRLYEEPVRVPTITGRQGGTART